MLVMYMLINHIAYAALGLFVGFRIMGLTFGERKKERAINMKTFPNQTITEAGV